MIKILSKTKLFLDIGIHQVGIGLSVKLLP